MALAVPLSRFTSRVGVGSAFFVRRLHTIMKKCANCGLDCSDETINCPACSTDTFVSATPQAFGHTISPAEARFWEQMTFRQFAIFIIRLQAIWFLFYAVDVATYLPSYFARLHETFASPDVRRAFVLALFRVLWHVAGAVVCIRYADRIVSWFVRDIIPKPPTISDDDKPAT